MSHNQGENGPFPPSPPKRRPTPSLVTWHAAFVQVQRDVLAERQLQRSRYSDEHDDAHDRLDWWDLIDGYAWQEDYVKMAALCMAAAEAQRRKELSSE